MRVDQLRKFMQILESISYSLDNSSKIFDLSLENIQKVIDSFKSSSDLNTRFLLDFYFYIQEESNWNAHLKHLKISNLEDIISDAIVQAKYPKNLLGYFRSNCYFDFKLFENPVEYIRYLDYIANHDSKELIPMFSNLSWVLKNLHGEKREEILSKVFQLNDSLEKHMSSLGEEQSISQFLDFVQKGYTSVSSYRWVKNLYIIDSEKKEEAQIVNQFLMDFPICDITSNLPNLFLNCYSQDYQDTIDILREIKDSEKDLTISNLLANYVTFDISCSNRELFNHKFKQVLSCQNKVILDAWLILLPDVIHNVFVDFDDKKMQALQLDDIFTTLSKFFDVGEENCMAIVSIIKSMPYDLWKRVPPETSLETLNLLYDSYELFANHEVLNPFDEDTYPNIEKICQLTSLSVQKIISLFETSYSFCSDYENNPNYFIQFLFEKETEASLDYILEKYHQCDELRKKQEGIFLNQNMKNISVDLKTVCQLLGTVPIDKILEGFSDEEEITPNTLVRTLKYQE